ncbi:MAG TPA: DNA-processing protein DprA [Bacillales bacterium]|nr:DNA-processing protein DprA [Bacillales bacterium]
MDERKEIRNRLIHIHACRGIGWKTIAKFFDYDRTLKGIFSLKESELSSVFSMRADRAERFHRDLHSTDVFDLLKEYRQKRIELVTIFDEKYPPHLKEIFDPPWVLYCKGNVSIFLESRMLSVVGTRNPSRSGFQALKKLLLPLIKDGWGVVSGLAAGIDGAAHRLSLGSRTIAVLGSGLDHIYPATSRPLADEIAASHLLVSEYPPDVSAQPWQFPHRNRVISGMTTGTLVVEAREKSGSLITADQALEQGRDVFAVPGSIFEPRSVGTNRLIQQGAKLVLNPEDLLEEWS